MEPDDFECQIEPPVAPKAGAAERRREVRRAITSVRLPLMGTRESDQGSFEYILVDISANGIGLLIPRWLVSRIHLKAGDQLNLHLPFQLQGRYYTGGRVVWCRWDEIQKAEVCGLAMAPSTCPYYPVFLSLAGGCQNLDLQDFDTLDHLLPRLLKDAYLLKQGIFIYLKHLTPYFYRVGEYPSADFLKLKDTLLDDIRSQIEAHAKALEALYDSAVRKGWSFQDLPAVLNLEDLRELMETEIQRDLMMIVFNKKAVQPYLNSIFELEKKQSNLFNTIVMLYTQALSVPPAA